MNECGTFWWAFGSFVCGMFIGATLALDGYFTNPDNGDQDE